MGSISQDSSLLARIAANNPDKLGLLPYDNFNWTAHAWETSETHGSVSHDQVSALLVILTLPDGSGPGEAGRLAGIDNFAQTARTCHIISETQSLEDILPTAADQHMFAENAAKHVAHILSNEVPSLSSHQNDLPDFFDLHWYRREYEGRQL